MTPNQRFLKQPKHFWANVRTISQAIGYTDNRQIKIPSADEMHEAMERLGLKSNHILNQDGALTALGDTLLSYFEHRADCLNNYVKPRLMDTERAKNLYEELQSRFASALPVTMNKQKGDKRAPAYFTAIINILIEANSEGLSCNYDPRELTTVTLDGVPLRTLARRVDGAFPSVVNPIAVWEIKEYYYTTTFGSRVADGVYESLLDGMELEELREHENIDVKHYLMADAYFTWWDCGRSYLCRIIDMLHMGYIDEVLFGYEVAERLPGLVKEWVAAHRQRTNPDEIR